MYENLLQDIVYTENVSRMCTNHKTILNKCQVSKEILNKTERKNYKGYRAREYRIP